MLIHIYDNLLVGDLKYRFEKCFNGLRLEFYDETLPGVSRLIEDKARVRDIRKIHPEGDLQIKSWFTVDEVEKAFIHYNLHVHVFKKTDERWIKLNPHHNEKLADLIVLNRSVA